MAATNLPKWVWDLVIALQQHEDEHAKGDTCLDVALTAIPEGVRHQAESISAYIRHDQTAPATDNT